MKTTYGDGITIDDGEGDYSTNNESKFGKHQYVNILINNVYKHLCTDWHGGYWSINERGGRVKIPSSRDSFINTITAFVATCPLIFEDKKKLEAIQNKFNAVKQDLNDENYLEEYRKKNKYKKSLMRGEGTPDEMDVVLNDMARRYVEVFDEIMIQLRKIGFFDTSNGVTE